jgi:ABC-type glutathione transport system ATPase component
VTVKVFDLMGMLAAIAAAISPPVSTHRPMRRARSTSSTPSRRPSSAAPRLPAASGTIIGAMLGALLMQSLQSGMVLLGLDTPLQNIVVGWCWSSPYGSTPSTASASRRSRKGRTMEQNQTPLVEMKDISIAFGGIRAVDGASCDLYPGEVVALLGHNGAGKST